MKTQKPKQTAAELEIILEEQKSEKDRIIVDRGFIYPPGCQYCQDLDKHGVLHPTTHTWNRGRSGETVTQLVHHSTKLWAPLTFFAPCLDSEPEITPYARPHIPERSYSRSELEEAGEVIDDYKEEEAEVTV